MFGDNKRMKAAVFREVGLDFLNTRDCAALFDIFLLKYAEHVVKRVGMIRLREIESEVEAIEKGLKQ